MNNNPENGMEDLSPPSILPPHYWVASVLCMIGSRLLLPVSPVLAPSQMNTGYLLGVLALAIGLWFAIQGSRLFAKVGTNIIPFTPASTLVTQGVFRFSRNPMYSGMVLALVGVALLTNQSWSWLWVVLFTLGIRYRFIAREEVQMQATFGDDFCRYRQRVRRWV